MNRLKGKWVVFLMLLLACVDPIEFEVPPAQFQVVIEGQVTDGEGPYSVRLSKALNISGELQTPGPIVDAEVTLYDDRGMSEKFLHFGNGEYQTGGAIRGEVGRAYHIKVETSNGQIFESEPDVLTAVGAVTDIRYEFEARSKSEAFGELKDDIFNIYIDADAGGNDERFVRWRFTGTYKVLTNPELHETWLQGELTFKTPLPCSGYVVIAGPGGILDKREECTCCTCWANQYETAPQLSDTRLSSGREFRNIKVGEVPINAATFYDKYMVVVEQLSMSRTAFDFFGLVKTQKEGAASLFQSPAAEILGNVRNVNGNDAVAGLFYASSISRKILFITRGEVPYALPPIDFATEECYRYYKNASTQQPALWQ